MQLRLGSLIWVGVLFGAASIGRPDSKMCFATIVFSDDFSSLTTNAISSTSFPSSERGPGDYYFTNSPDGWAVSGLILNFDRSDNAAVYLHETGATSISRSIEGLQPGRPYLLSFEYWGDNVTNDYEFSCVVDTTTFPFSPIHSGQNTGIFHIAEIHFTPQTATLNLRLVESSRTTSSPIIDNVMLSRIVQFGDYNSDGSVNAADYTVWRNNLGTAFDLNGNGDETLGSAGVVDRADYDLWKLHYGEPHPSGSGESQPSNGIPEPGTMTLVVLGALVMLANAKCLPTLK